MPFVGFVVVSIFRLLGLVAGAAALVVRPKSPRPRDFVPRAATPEVEAAIRRALRR